MEAQTSVARGATSLFAANVAALLANTLYFLILTNMLRSTLNVGVVTALNIMIWLLVTVCILAQPVTLQSPVPAPLAVLKFIPELLAKNARGGAARVFRVSLTFTGILGAAIAVILALFPNLVIALLGGQAVLPEFIRLSAVDVLVLSIGQVCLGALIALGDMKRATIYIIGWSIARYSFASVLLVPYAITGVLWGFILGDVILLLAGLQRTVRDIRGGTGSSSFSLADLSRYALYTVFSALIGFAIGQADKLFTLAQQGLPELAIYNVAIVAASFTGFAPYALTTVLLPALSALHASNKAAEIREMIRAYTRYVSIVVIPIAFGFASLAEVALRIFGPQYPAGLAPTVIVSVATGLTAVGAVYAGALLALGELRWYTAANVLGLVSLFIVVPVFTPILGLSGPALGRATLLVVAALTYAYAALRKGFFELDVGALVIATIASVLMGAVVFGVLTAFQSFLVRLALVVPLVLVGGAIYIAVLRAFRLLSARDLEFAMGVSPKRFRSFLPKVAKLAGIRT